MLGKAQIKIQNLKCKYISLSHCCGVGDVLSQTPIIGSLSVLDSSFSPWWHSVFLLYTSACPLGPPRPWAGHCYEIVLADMQVNKIVYYSFIDAGRRLRTPGPEMRGLVTYDTAARTASWWCSCSMGTMGVGVGVKWCSNMGDLCHSQGTLC